MIKKEFILLICIFSLSIITYSLQLSDSEIETRILFSESLNLLFNDQKFEARLKLNEAMSGEIYIEDLPKLWYYAAKLDLQLGLIDRAKEDIENIMLFASETQEVRTLRNFIQSMEKFSLTNYSTPTFFIHDQIHGIQNTYDRFFIPNDIEVINSTTYVLDSQNNRIFKTNNFESKWIFLPEDFDFYSINTDKNLNRIYLGSSGGIFYFEPYSEIISFELTRESTITYKPNNIETQINSFYSKSPIITYGVTAAGFIICYDPYNNHILTINHLGEVINTIVLDSSFIIFDGIIWHNYLYILEATNNKIYKYDLKTDIMDENFSFNHNHPILSIDILPWGNLLFSDLEGKIYFINDNNEKVEINNKINVNNFTGSIKYQKGYFLLMDKINYNIKSFRVLADSDFPNYTLNMYALNFNRDKLEVQVKFNLINLLGQKVEYVTRDLILEDSNTRVSFNYSRLYTKPDIFIYEDINEFFDTGIAQIKTDSFVILKGILKDELNVNQTIPLLLTSSSIYYLTDENNIDDTLKEIIYTTGGKILKTKYEDELYNYLYKTYKPVDFLNYRLFPPVYSGLKQTRMIVNFNNTVLSDSMYYYTEGVGIVE